MSEPLLRTGIYASWCACCSRLGTYRVYRRPKDVFALMRIACPICTSRRFYIFQEYSRLDSPEFMENWLQYRKTYELSTDRAERRAVYDRWRRKIGSRAARKLLHISSKEMMRLARVQYPRLPKEKRDYFLRLRNRQMLSMRESGALLMEIANAFEVSIHQISNCLMSARKYRKKRLRELSFLRAQKALDDLRVSFNERRYWEGCAP